MSQPANQPDLEGGNPNHHLDRQPIGSTPNQPPQGESNFGDSSGPFFSIYSKAADDEDNKMVERWQKDADGILIFTGLFSAAVAALLAVTVQDLRPNSQDASAFYLGNIYQVLADPNATRSSIPSSVPKPPPFSPPRYAIWVNSLWFLSLVIGLTCALIATSLHQWSRRYIQVAQLARCRPEKRARMRAFFADGMDKMHIPWAVEGLPALLHLSVFLFFGGLAIFLFNIDHGVFGSVIWWIGLFSIVYGLITVMPIIRHDSPYYSPLSRSAWFLYTGMNYVLFKILLIFHSGMTLESFNRLWGLKDRYHGWMSGGVEKAVEDTVSERSPEIDTRIFEWTLGVLGEDESLEKFFEAIPGLFTSKLVNSLESYFPLRLFETFWEALYGFRDRTLTSNSVPESVKSRRLVICRDIASVMPCPPYFDDDRLRSQFDQKPVSIEEGQAMARWLTNKDTDVAHYALIGVARNLLRMRECDNNWIALTSGAYGTSESDIIARGDNALLATLIDISRRAIHSDDVDAELVGELTQFDIHNTLPRLQHDFCTLWNELVQEAGNQGPHSTLVCVLRLIRHLYIALHQGTDAAPTAFSASTQDFYILSDPSLYLSDPSLYPTCNIDSHRPDSTTVPNSHAVSLPTQPGDSPDAFHLPSPGGSTVPDQAEQVVGPPSSSDSTTPGGIGDSSQAPAATSPILLVHTIPLHTDASPPGAVAAVPRDISLASTSTHPFKGTTQLVSVAPVISQHPDHNALQSIASSAYPSHPLEGDKQHDTVAPLATPEISEISPTVNPIPRSAHTFTPTIILPTSPDLLPVLSATAEPPSSVESAPLQTDHIPHTLRSLSFTADNSHTSPQVASAPDAEVTSSMRTPSSQDDTHDLNPHIPMTVLPHSDQTARPIDGIVAATLRPEDQVQHDLDAL